MGNNGTPSRPQRLADLVYDCNELLQEYAEWLDGMPDNLENSPTAEKLNYTVDTLDNVVSELEGLQGELPLGFGND
jgi:hypothetical protein